VQLKIGAWHADSDEGGAEFRTCTQWVRHPDYVPEGDQQPDYSDYQDYDFALCKLGEPIFVDESVGRLVVNTDPDFPPAGEMATVIGLGRLSDDSFPNITQDVDAPVVSTEECDALYVDYDGFGLGDGNLKVCVGGSDPDIFDNPKQCDGDSGGPHVIKTENGEHILFGVTSWGPIWCGASVPGVAARVSAVIDWIEETACDELESEFYCASDAPSLEPTDCDEATPPEVISSICMDGEDFLFWTPLPDDTIVIDGQFDSSVDFTITQQWIEEIGVAVKYENTDLETSCDVVMFGDSFSYQAQCILGVTNVTIVVYFEPDFEPGEDEACDIEDISEIGAFCTYTVEIPCEPIQCGEESAAPSESFSPSVAPSDSPIESSAPSGSPSLEPSPEPSSKPLHPFCVDDPAFRANDKDIRTCEWIAKKPTTRCLLDSGAEIGCAATCNPGCIGCADDPDYRNKGKEKRTCEWVGKKPAKRCADGASFDACPASCNPICETRCTNNPEYRNAGKPKRTCTWVGKKDEKRCALSDGEPFFGCPATCNPDCD